jgi:ABC-type bacteriocin/lantibiotic exporter with double-glycine peptidase domain
VKIVGQRAEGDCGIAALATLLGLAYEDVYVAASGLDKERGKSGLYVRDIMEIARQLGAPMRINRRPDLDDCRGVLKVKWRKRAKGYGGHYVVLYEGMVVDPSGPMVLPHEEWFAAHENGRAAWLLEAE